MRVLATLSVLAAAACDSPVARASDRVERIVLTPTSSTLQVGGTLSLSALVLDAAGDVLRDRKVVWTSEDDAVATVTQSGVVIAVTAGSVQIAASSGGKSASALVTVAPRPVSLVRITPGTATISVAGSLALRAEAVDASGAPVLNRLVAWESSNEAVAIINANGIVAGLAPGNVTITATVDGRAGTAEITVAPQPVASVVVTPANDTIVLGTRATLRATALDAQNTPLAGRIVLWSSDNATVATVSSDGEVIGLAIGSARITATVEGKSAVASVVVQPVPVARVVTTPNQITLTPGQTSQLTVTLNDSAGNVLTGRAITYSSSDEQVATVSATGLITAVAQGTAQVDIASEGATASVTVTVNPVPIAAIRITPNGATLHVSQTTRLVAQALDAGGGTLSNRSFTWTSSAPNVATVDQGGVVTALAVGAAQISAASEGQVATATVNVSNVPVASLTIAPKPVALVASQQQQLTVQLVDSAGGVLSPAGRTITWTSRSPAVVTVTSSGLLTGVAAGSAWVLASTSGASAPVFDSVGVTVTGPPTTSLTVQPQSQTMLPGETRELRAVISSGGVVVRGSNVVWQTRDASIASVAAIAGWPDSAAVVSVSLGATYVVASEPGGLRDSALISVTPPIQAAVHSVTVTSPRGYIVPGDTMHLTVVLRDAQNNVLTGRAVTFTASPAKNVSVDTAGIVTGVATSGSSDITATSEGMSGSVQISSVAAVASMTITGPTNSALDLLILAGGTKRYTITLVDGSGNPVQGQVVTIQGSSSAVLGLSSTSVTTNGQGRATVDITGSARGSATVTFTVGRAGAIPPGTPGNNTATASLLLVVL